MANKKAGKGSAPGRATRTRRTRAAGGSKDKNAAPKTAPKDAARKAAKPAASLGKTRPAAKKPRTPSRRPAARRAGAGPRPSPSSPARTARGRRSGAPRSPAQDILPPGPETDLSEEDAIRSAKYTPRDLPPRIFEEERFLFPETYGLNRVRLLVRDPEWLFAYWDVSPAAMKDLARSLGERTLAVSRLTLRITDPVSGGSSDVLLPAGARWWYVRADSTPRSYRAELGLTLPSGEYRRISESNTVVTPRVGPSPQRATRRMSYRQAGALPADAATAMSLEDARATAPPPGPWSAPSIDGTAADASPSGQTAGGTRTKGGASDTFRPGQPGGASDVHRR